MTKALAVYRKELRQISRDKRTLLILVFIPAFFLLLYGYALNFDIRHVRLAVEDRDGTPESRAVVSAFINSGYFDLAATSGRRRKSIGCSNLNDVRAALVIPEGFGRDVRSGRTSPVQVLISGDNANTATTVLGYADEHPPHRRGAARPGRRGARAAGAASSRASGTTPSFAARCSWCRASSPTSR